MKEYCFVPDTNFFLDFPEFEQYFAPAHTLVRLVIVYPVLVELDRIRAGRFKNPDGSARQSRGFQADQVMTRLTALVSTRSTDIRGEVFRVREIPESGHPDAQIVDHVIAFARQVRPETTVFFITRDGGLPTVLAHDEIRRHDLGDVLHVAGPEMLSGQLGRNCDPDVTLEDIRLLPEADWRAAVEIRLACDLTAYDMKGEKLLLQAYYLDAKGEMCGAMNWRQIDSPIEKVSGLELRMPFAMIGTRPGQPGLTHIPLTLTAGQRGREPYPLCNTAYCLDLAPDRVMLTMNVPA